MSLPRTNRAPTSMSTPMIHLHPLVADEMRVPIQIEHLVASWKLKARAAAVCLDLHHPAEEAVGSRDLAARKRAARSTPHRLRE